MDEHVAAVIPERPCPAVSEPSGAAYDPALAARLRKMTALYGRMTRTAAHGEE